MGRHENAEPSGSRVGPLSGVPTGELLWDALILNMRALEAPIDTGKDRLLWQDVIAELYRRPAAL